MLEVCPKSNVWSGSVTSDVWNLSEVCLKYVRKLPDIRPKSAVQCPSEI